MGVLTDDISRLSGEILALRKGRESLNMALAQESLDRKDAVTEMCAGFTRVRAEMARETDGARRAFLNGVKQGVHRHCSEVQADLTGARRAWMGRSR